MEIGFATIIGIGVILAIAFAITVRILKKPKETQRQEAIPMPTVDTAQSAQHYIYEKRPRIVTNYELLFYHVLAEALNDSYAIIPQAHLSTFLNHKIHNHQNWSIALTKINKKSVDFLICHKETLRPLFAIELDDSSHNQPNRIKRDTFVNEIFATANMPLVRFRSGEWPHAQAVKAKIRATLSAE